MNTPALMTYHPGLGFRLFGKTITLGKIVGGLIRSTGSIVTGIIRRIPVIGPDAASWADEFLKRIAGKAEAAIDFTIAANLRTAKSTTTVTATDFTTAEAAIVTAWNTAKFTPWAKAITDELAIAVAKTSTWEKLTAINAVADKINAVQDHYAVAETTGLSQTAVDLRNEMIYYALSGLNYIIKKVVSDIGAEAFDTSFKPSKYNFSPLFTTTPVTSVPTENYRLPASAQLPAATAPVTPTNPTTNVTAPATIPATTPVNTLPATAAQGIGRSTIIKGAADSAPLQSTAAILSKEELDAKVAEFNKAKTPEAQSNTVLIVGGVAAVCIAIYAFTRKKNKE